MKRNAFFLMMILFLSLSGCGTKKGNERNQREELVLNVVTTYSGTDGNAKYYKKALHDFEEKHGVTICDHSVTSDETFKKRIETDFRVGAEPDVLFFFQGGDADSFIREGKVVSIDKIREEFPDYAGNMEDNLIKASQIDGKKYAVPVNGYWEALYYNEEVLRASGVKIPDATYTWDQFLKDCSKIKASGYIPIAAALGEIPHYWWEYGVFNQNTPENHKMVPKDINEKLVQAWMAGMEDIKQLYTKGYFPQNTLSAKDEETFMLFTGGKAAFLLDGSWRMGGIVAACEETDAKEIRVDEERLTHFGVTYVPAKKNRKPTDLIGGISMGYYITKKAWENPAKREAAVEFVTYMTSDSLVEQFSRYTVSPLKTKTYDKNKQDNSLQRKVLEMLENATSFTDAIQDSMNERCRATMFDGMPQIVTDEISTKDAVEKGLKIYTEKIKKERLTCIK